MGVFDKSLGVLLIGIFFNTYLYGVVTHQYALYRNTKFNDPRWIKMTVFSMFALDTFHSASVIYMAWVYYITNHANPQAIHNTAWPYPFTVIATSAAAFLTQCFLGYRIFRLTKSKIIYCAIVVLSVVALIMGTVCGIFVWQVTSRATVTHLQPLIAVWQCFEVGVDAVITGILSYVLSRSRTGFHRSDTIINRIIRAAIQTGLLCGIFSILSLIFFLTMPGTHFFGMLGIPIGRVYSNTLMDTLMSRHGLRGLVGSNEVQRSDAIWMAGEVQTSSMTPRSRTHNSIQLHIRKDVESRIDDGQPSPDASGKFYHLGGPTGSSSPREFKSMNTV
ncbi:hypothetical protein BDZ94DRAFT_645408 [Collybia nuda]|uniref:DUF6534 domain-containing protein n=1 Tax=Collybia nuda TaxID=64659 RepID=A0A9P5Y481_9AGAR|nr:hypothetical protein BDZ94DRAFT_645408 [Collybia nuda]